MTRSALESTWVTREWQDHYHAEVQSGRVRVLPCLREQCELPSLLRDKRYADFRTDYASGLQQLLDALRPDQGHHRGPSGSSPQVGQAHLEAKVSQLEQRFSEMQRRIAERSSDTPSANFTIATVRELAEECPPVVRADKEIARVWGLPEPQIRDLGPITKYYGALHWLGITSREHVEESLGKFGDDVLRLAAAYPPPTDRGVARGESLWFLALYRVGMQDDWVGFKQFFDELGSPDPEADARELARAYDDGVNSYYEDRGFKALTRQCRRIGLRPTADRQNR